MLKKNQTSNDKKFFTSKLIWTDLNWMICIIDLYSGWSVFFQPEPVDDNNDKT